MKNEITINDLKNYISSQLKSIPYRFKLFTDLGKYVKSYSVSNIRKGVINAIMQITDSDILRLGGGMQAVALDLTVKFLVPVPDDAYSEDGDFNGDYTFIEEFRSALEKVFAQSDVFKMTANEKTYVGGFSASFPMSGELEQRQGIGYSIEYTCYFQFSYLAGAVNSSDVLFFLDDDEMPIPYTGYSIERDSTLTANVYSNTGNGESNAYAENTVLGVKLTLPAITPTANKTAEILYNFLMGVESEKANTPHTLTIQYGENTKSLIVILAKIADNGEYVTNISRTVSFVPYIQAEDED